MRRLTVSSAIILCACSGGSGDSCPHDVPYKPANPPFKVGYQELTFTDSARGRTLKTAFWYPSIDGEAGASNAFMGGAPDTSGGPYPLILYSHGDHWRSTNGQGDALKIAWAGQGFVVAAPDHQKGTSYDADDSPANRAAIQFDRPRDIRFITDQALALNANSTTFLSGMVDPQAIGVSGHSFGGHTTVMVAGATPNLDHLAEYCRVYRPENCGVYSSNLDVCWDVCSFQDLVQQLYPGQRVIDESDPRVKAALSMSGDGYGWFWSDGMAKIKIPIMYVVGRRDTVCPLDTQAMPEYEETLSTKYLLVMNEADHSSTYGGSCSQASCDECAAIHDRLGAVSIAFWKAHLKHDAGASDLLRTNALDQSSGTLVMAEGR